MRASLRAVVALVGLTVVALQWRSRGEGRAMQQVRDQALEARDQAQACVLELAIAESGFQRLREEVDSLRSAVGAMEALDPRGVPAERYEEYLSTVEAFNAGVRRWDAAADGLRATEARCRRSVETYNALADSVRGGAPPPPVDP